MDIEFITMASQAKVSRDRVHSWNHSDRRSKKRSPSSLERVNPRPDFLDTILKQDHDRSSVVSDFPSFHGIKNKEGSLHSMNVKHRLQKQELLHILNDSFLARETASEKLSARSELSYGGSQRERKRIFQIPNEPFRILDTPGIEDNYYTNVLSWSSQNVIGVSLSNIVYLFNYETSDSDELFQAPDELILTSLAFSPDGDYLAVGMSDGSLQVWDTMVYKMVRVLQLHSDRITCIDWQRQGLLTGSKDTHVSITDTRAKEKKGVEFDGHSQEIVGLKWSTDGKHFASGGNDNMALVYDLSASNGNTPLMKIKHKAAVRAIGWSHKKPGLLATGGGYSDATIRTYDVSRSLLVDERETDGQVCSIVFSRLTNDLISSHGLPTNDISVWRTNGLKRVVQLMGHEVRPIHICLSPDGSTLISASADETLRFWRLFDNESIKRQTGSCVSVKNKDCDDNERHTSINREDSDWEPDPQWAEDYDDCSDEADRTSQAEDVELSEHE